MMRQLLPLPKPLLLLQRLQLNCLLQWLLRRLRLNRLLQRLLRLNPRQRQKMLHSLLRLLPIRNTLPMLLQLMRLPVQLPPLLLQRTIHLRKKLRLRLLHH
jgi:hypothetical protein